MEKIKIKDIDEYVYYEKLSNGLDVYLYTKDTVHNNYVTFNIFNIFYDNIIRKKLRGIL